jgi:hypothetical protein
VTKTAMEDGLTLEEKDLWFVVGLTMWTASRFASPSFSCLHTSILNLSLLLVMLCM